MLQQTLDMYAWAGVTRIESAKNHEILILVKENHIIVISRVTYKTCLVMYVNNVA